MQQVLLNVEDGKIESLINFLKTINYVTVETYNESNLHISEEEKKIMRKRVKNSKTEDFKNWDDVINSFEL